MKTDREYKINEETIAYDGNKIHPIVIWKVWNWGEGERARELCFSLVSSNRISSIRLTYFKTKRFNSINIFYKNNLLDHN